CAWRAGPGRATTSATSSVTSKTMRSFFILSLLKIITCQERRLDWSRLSVRCVAAITFLSARGAAALADDQRGSQGHRVDRGVRSAAPPQKGAHRFLS